MVSFNFHARGDPRITALHPTTLEVTREEVKSHLGDCIVAAGANASLRELPEDLKRAMRSDGATIILTIEAEGLIERITGEGSRRLELSSGVEMVTRKSRYICGRTMMIGADKAARDLDRKLVRSLSDQGVTIGIRIEALPKSR